MTATTFPLLTLDEWTQRILRELPQPWTSDQAKAVSGILYSLMGAVGNELIIPNENNIYALDATRIQTALDTALDAQAANYFSTTLGFPANVTRQPGEPDAAFRIRILNALLQPAATRDAIIQLITELVGTAPRVSEPWNILDHGAYSQLSFYSVDSEAYPSRYGNQTLRYQGFVETALPPYAGAPVPVYGYSMGTFYSAQTYYLDPPNGWWIGMQIMDGLLSRARVYGTVIWRRYLQQPYRTVPFSSTYPVSAGATTLPVEIFPGYADPLVVIAQPSWNTSIGWTQNSTSKFTLEFSVPPPATGSVDFLVASVTEANFGLALSAIGQTTQVVKLPSDLASGFILGTTTWPIVPYLSSSDSSSFTIEYQAPAGGVANLGYAVVPVTQGGFVNPTPGASTCFVYPPANLYSKTSRVFVMPSWNTTCAVTKYGASFAVTFDILPPSGATLYYGIFNS